MDEKTEELRDIFTDLADDETVTESQEEPRGTVASSEEVTERLGDVVGSMRMRYDFRTDLDTDDLVTVVRGFYDGHDDAEIATDLDVSPESVARARVDLHLVTDADRDAPFDLEAKLGEDADVEDVAADVDASVATVRHYAHVLAVDEERRLVADRFRTEFERLLTDGDLAERLTDEVKQTGLEEAAEDIETDVSF